MAVDFEIKRGDTAPSLVAVLKDRAGTAVNLSTAASVLFVMRATGAASNSTPKVSRPSTVTADQTVNTGQVTHEWQVADTALSGSFVAEFVVTWADGREQTFPTAGFITITIYDDLEAHTVSMMGTPDTPMMMAAVPLVGGVPAPAVRGLVMTSDAQAKATIARKTASSTAPILTDADLDELVKYAKRADGGYNTNRAAAEGWRWKAARAAGGFTFTADGVQVDKSMLMAHCESMVKMYSRGQVRTVVGDTGLMPFEQDWWRP